MGDHTGIEWTDATWNPVVGCAHVSPGCDHCYAARETSGRLRHLPIYSGLAEGGRFTGEVRVVPDRLDQPLRWRKPRRVFVNSMSDLFHAGIPHSYVADVWGVMLLAQRHTFQILTKRPQLMAQVLGTRTFYDLAAESANEWPDRFYEDELALNFGLDAGPPDIPGQPLPNVWLGTSIENDRYTFRADHVRATPAAVRFLSLEPLLGPLPSLNLDGIDWVIVGGESGPGARPMHPGWARDIRDQCIAAGVPFLFKQWGAWQPVEPVYAEDSHDDVLIDAYDVDVVSLNRQGEIEMRLPRASDPSGHQPSPSWACDPWWLANVGKHAAGRELDGRTWDEYPS